MKYEIKNRWSCSIVYQDEAESFRALILAAIKSRANLSGADLSGANLSRADLSRANLSGANLSGADLSWANLSRADLSRANLSGANLSGADLSVANLSRADLSGADLSGANLYGANLSRADLYGADLSGANLSRADLYWADLSRADLSGANLYGANLYGYFSFGPCGSRSSYTWARWEDAGYTVHCGCATLSLKDFKKAVAEKHGKTYHAKVYLSAIKTMELIAKESEGAFRNAQKKSLGEPPCVTARS